MANWVADYFEQHPDVAGLPVAARHRHSLHVHRRGRRQLALVTGAPMHYFAPASRQWLPLDTRLKRRADGTYAAPGLPFVLSPDGGVRLADGAYRQRSWRVGIFANGRFSEIGRLGQGRPHQDRLIREAGIFRHETILTPSGLREELTVLESPAVDATPGSLLVLETLLPLGGFPDGWMDEPSSGKVRFPRGWAQDAAGRRIPLMRWVNEKRMVSGVPFEWLTQAAFPVVIDPDVEITGHAADGWMEGPNPSTSSTHDSAGININVGSLTFGSAPHVWRGYVKFDTSSLGTGAIVEQANLKMYPFALGAYIPWTIYVRQYNWSANDPMASGTREAAWDGLLAAGNAALLATSTNPAGLHVVSQNLPTDWIQVEGHTYYGLWCNQEGYAFPNNLGGYHQYSSASHTTPIQRPLLMLEYLAGYPRSGPLPLRGVLPRPRVSLVDTRRKLRGRSRRTALHVAMDDEK